MTNEEVLEQIREIPHLGSRNWSNGVYTYDPKALALIQSFRESVIDEFLTVGKALAMSKLVHELCKDVPHDIGLKLLDQLKQHG